MDDKGWPYTIPWIQTEPLGRCWYKSIGKVKLNIEKGNIRVNWKGWFMLYFFGRLAQWIFLQVKIINFWADGKSQHPKFPHQGDTVCLFWDAWNLKFLKLLMFQHVWNQNHPESSWKFPQKRPQIHPNPTEIARNFSRPLRCGGDTARRSGRWWRIGTQARRKACKIHRGQKWPLTPRRKILEIHQVVSSFDIFFGIIHQVGKANNGDLEGPMFDKTSSSSKSSVSYQFWAIKENLFKVEGVEIFHEIHQVKDSQTTKNVLLIPKLTKIFCFQSPAT